MALAVKVKKKKLSKTASSWQDLLSEPPFKLYVDQVVDIPAPVPGIEQLEQIPTLPYEPIPRCELLDRIAKRIVTHGWMRGSIGGPGGPGCLAGHAFYAAFPRHAHSMADGISIESACQNAFGARSADIFALNDGTFCNAGDALAFVNKCRSRAGCA